MLTLAILAGGRSQRMGQNKAFLPLLGQPLVCHVMKRLAPLAEETIIVAPPLPEFTSLGLRVIPDLWPDRGPLGGLYTALCSASHPLVAVTGCDMPFASAALFSHELEMLLDEGIEAVVPCSPRGPEPLHAVYRREACLRAVRESLEDGENRMTGWFSKAQVHLLTPEETGRFDPLDRAFFNVNTLDDLAEAGQWVGGRPDGAAGFHAILA